jgi:hypothetical protein
VRPRDARVTRLFAMDRWVEEVLSEEKLVSWGKLFHFATIEPDIYESHALYTNPVWYQPFSTTTVALFPPPQVEEPHGDNTPANETYPNPF